MAGIKCADDEASTRNTLPWRPLAALVAFRIVMATGASVRPKHFETNSMAYRSDRLGIEI